MMVDAPLTRASAIVHRPTAPVPCTSTVSAGRSIARSMMWTAVSKSATAADILVKRHTVWQTCNTDTWLEVDGLRPAAKQSVLCGIRDAVDASRDTPVGV